MKRMSLYVMLPVAATLLVADGGDGDLLGQIRSEVAKPLLSAEAGKSSFATVYGELERADAAADAAWRSLKSRAEYDSYRSQLRAKYLAALGGFPERTPLRATVTGSVVRETYRVDKVLFESRPGVFVTGLLYLPQTDAFKPPYDTVLVLCGHSNEGKGLKGYQRGCVQCVEAGLAAFIIDPIGQGERIQVPSLGNTAGHNLFGVNALLVGQSMAGFRLWDAVRALDYLETRTELRHASYGVMGNSGGGTMTALLEALDPRIRAGAPSCYISSLREVCRREGPQDAEQNIFGQLTFGLNHAGYVLMGGNAVRLHCCHGDFFPFGGSQETFRTVQATAANCGIGADFYGMTDVPGPHGWKESARASSVRWMRRWLRNETKAIPIDVEACRRLDVGFRAESVDCGLAAPAANPQENYNVTPNGSVSELPGFRTVYDYLRDELDKALKARKPRTAAETATVVRRRAGIRNLDDLGAQVRTLGKSSVGAVGIERMVCRFPGGLDVPAVLLMPESVTQEPVLFVGDGGRERLVGRALSFLRRGHPVLLADLIATGEIGKVVHRFYGLQNDEEPAVMLYLLGKSLVGVRAEEILALSEFLGKRFGQTVSLMADGRIAVPGAHAFAVEPGLFAGLDVSNPPPSWTSLVRTSDSPCPYANAVTGALLDYDWVELIERTGE